MKKSAAGILALVCLAAAGGIWLTGQYDQIWPAFFRVGLVLLALWLALPEHGQQLLWSKIAPVIAVGVAAVAISRKAVLYLLPALIVAGIVLVFLRPKPKRRPPERV